MAAPDFSKTTIDTLAKRASYRCSNPDCRAPTIGPNTDPEKIVLIGEAAHIRGARPKSRRYFSGMSDLARAEITNGIWLCRNCHKLVDSDDCLFSSETLFAWREDHEKHALAELGRASDKIQLEQQNLLIASFYGYPAIVRRIVIDRPDGWEWRLAAELLRYLNKPHFRRIKDLREGLYVKRRTHISDEDVLDWIDSRLNEVSNMVDPITKLLDSLTSSFGRSGEHGDLEEIHHICKLIGDYVEEIVHFEESLYFASVPYKAGRALELLKDCMGSQAEKFASIPDTLDEVVSLLDTDHSGTKENPLVIKKTITIELPKDWSREINREYREIEKHYFGSSDTGYSSFWLIVIVVIIIIALV